MAGKSDIRAGGAFVDLFTKDAALVKGLRSAQKRLHSFGKGVMAVGGFFTGLGALITVPFGAAVRSFAESGNEIQKMSERTGLAASNLAELSYAAEQSGTDMEHVEKALKGIAKHGLQMANFDRIAAWLNSIPNASFRAARAVEMFGKSGMMLLPLMANLKALRAEAQRRGIVSSDETFKLAAQMQSAFLNIRRMVKSIWAGIGTAIAPALIPALTIIDNILISVRKWVVRNGELIRTVFMVGTVLLGVGTVIAAVGSGIFALGTAAGMAATVMTTIGSVLGVILSPLGLLVVGLLAGVAAFYYFTETGRQGLAFLKEQLADLWGIARDTFGSIADAMAAGDLALAAKVAWAGIKLAWLQGTDWLLSLWNDAKFAFMDVWTGVQSWFSHLFIDAFAGVEFAWVNMVSFLEDIWSKFITGMMNGWQRAQQGIGNFIIDKAEKAGLVSKEFAQAWRESLNAPIDEQVGKRTVDAQQRQAEIEAQRKKREEEIALNQAGAHGILGDERERQRKGLADQHAAAEEERKKALNDAMTDFNKAREAAANARKNAEGGKGNQFKTPEFAPASSTTVTFSGAALALAGQGTPMQGMAKTLREQLGIQRDQEKHLRVIAAKEGVVAE
jgi:hypothetical protein